MKEFWIIPLNGKRILTKAERYEIKGDVIIFYNKSEEISIYMKSNIVGITIQKADDANDKQFGGSNTPKMPLL